MFAAQYVCVRPRWKGNNLDVSCGSWSDNISLIYGIDKIFGRVFNDEREVIWGGVKIGRNGRSMVESVTIPSEMNFLKLNQ